MIDMAKGIAIVLVVYGHCLRGLVAAGTVSDRSWLVITDYVIYTFHMPLFFVASGLFIQSAIQRSARVFWTGRVKTLVYPYFLWSLLLGSTQIILSGSSATNNGMDLTRLSQIWWIPIPPFWFLYSLFFCCVIAWALRFLRAEMLMIAGIILFLITFYIGGGVLNDIAYGLTYFALGMIIRERGWLKALPSSFIAASTLAFMFLAVALASFYVGVPERMPIGAAVLGVIATATFCRAIERRLPQSLGVKILATLGQYSMGIYVMHIIILGLIRTILLRFLGITEVSVLISVAVLAAVVVPTVVQQTLVRLGLNTLAGLPFSASVRQSTAR
jgi:fucose 4-O-acetylase-like acetyltransferase